VTADFPVVLDACVLANQSVTDLLLRLAETPRLYLPYWSEQILEETTRTLIEKLGWPQELARYREEQMRDHFPEAIIRFPKSLLSVLTNDEKDRHVLAAAIRAKVEVIVTFNLRHFGPEHLKPWEISASSPDQFLMSLMGLQPMLVFTRITEIGQARKIVIREVLMSLRRSVPRFAEIVAGGMSMQLGPPGAYA
jgi:predicted nucleic acid-binding protein